MIRHAARYRKNIDRMQQLVDELTERRAANAGWLSMEVLGFVVLSLFLLPMFIGDRIAYLIMAAALGVAAWRLLPNWLRMREIRELSRML